jgi:hypothetical protein
MRWTLWAVVLAAASYATELSAQQPRDTLARQQQRALDSLAALIRELTARIQALEAARQGGDTAALDELARLRAAAAAAAADSAAAQPQQPRLGLNALNPEISVTGDIRGNARSGAPGDNFTAREFEFAFQSTLDPFSTAKIFLSLEEGTVSLEEGYAYFTALPGHLRLDVGQFRQQVGELNRWHLHGLSTDEYPLVLRRYAGEEGLVAAGASLYWPLPFSGPRGTYELTVQATAGSNEVLFAGGNRPSLSAQLSGFWQFSRSTFGQLSLSGLTGSNPDSSLRTTLGVLAARFSWRPPQLALSRELTVRGELWSLRRRFASPGDAFFDRARLGGYLEGTWKLNRQWIAGLRGDWVQSPEPGPLQTEWAVTPVLTFWQSEFVYARALYEHWHTLSPATRRRLTLQVVFAMGPHKHELF